MLPGEAHLPWGANYGGVNGASGVFGRQAIESYLTAFSHLDGILADGCPCHPESIVCYAMERDGCQIHRTLGSEFAFVREHGLEHMVVLPQELARYTAALITHARAH